MWPDRVSNPGPLALKSDELLTALCGPAIVHRTKRLYTLCYDGNIFYTVNFKKVEGTYCFGFGCSSLVHSSNYSIVFKT